MQQNCKWRLCEDRGEMIILIIRGMQQTNRKGLQNEVWLVGEGDSLGIVQEVKMWPSTKWYM